MRSPAAADVCPPSRTASRLLPPPIASWPTSRPDGIRCRALHLRLLVKCASNPRFFEATCRPIPGPSVGVWRRSMPSYIAIRVQQKPDARPFYLFSAAAAELLEWADVPRKKAAYLAGYQ